MTDKEQAVTEGPEERAFAFVRKFAKRDPVFAKGVDKDRIKEAHEIIAALDTRPSPVGSAADGAEDEAYEVGKADGYALAVQIVDRLTGGEGEYFASTLPGNGIPDAAAMMAGISERFDALAAAPSAPDPFDRSRELRRMGLNPADYPASAPDTANSIGAAERDVGRWVYSRIEALIDAAPGTPDGDELSRLAFIAESVEEYGFEHCAGLPLVHPSAPDTAREKALETALRGIADLRRHSREDALDNAETMEAMAIAALKGAA